MTEIIKNIYIGPISVVYDNEQLKKFDVIVNCTKENYEKELNITQKYYQIPVDDTARQENIDNFVVYSRKIIDEVIEEYNKNKCILIHCSQGVQRSAAFAAYFFIKRFGITLDESIKFIVQAKPNCFFHGYQVNFMESLEKLVVLRT